MATYDFSSALSRQGPEQKGLRRFSKLLAFSTFFLIFAGSLVTSTDSGLSVPDWPSSYGYFMFSFPLANMVGGIFYEHGHRLIASTVGFLTLVMAFWILFREERKWLKVIGFVALAAVITQGILGGITVLYFLPPAVSVGHAVLAQSFFCLTIFMAYSFSKERRLRELDIAPSVPKSFRVAICTLVGFVYLQLILGALMRHTGSGLAIPDFPQMGAQWSPLFNADILARINSIRFDLDLSQVALSQVWIHFAHRIWAFAVVTALLVVNVLFFKHKQSLSRLQSVLFALNALVVLQIALGVFTVLSTRQMWITSFHVLTGASILGFSFLTLLKTFPVKWTQVRQKIQPVQEN